MPNETEPVLAKAPTDKPKAPDCSDVFLREVDDAVRRGDLESFIRRFGWWILGGILLILAAWGGYIIYSNNQTEANGVVAESYIQAMDASQSGNAAQEADAMKTFETIGKDGSVGYRASSALMQANLLAKQGKSEEAVAMYAKVVADSSLPKAFRDLALMRQTIIEYDSMKPADVIARMEPLAKAGEPFFGTAGELTGLALLESGKKKEAGAMFKALAEDDKVPGSIRSRAALLANQMGIDVDLKAETDKDDKEKADAATE